MPELPEMENYKIHLNNKITGQTITAVDVNRIKSINVNPNLFKKTVSNQKVLNVSRRGKHLLFHLQNGQVLLLHLMLGGWMYFGQETDKPKRTIQVRLSFGHEHLYFIGLRLGYLHLHTPQDAEKKLSHLGPEPLDPSFSENEFMDRLKTKHGRLKTALIDQDFIAGIGNCYSAEICFHAKILPIKDIDELNNAAKSQLYQSMKTVLSEGIRLGGYMENPFFKEDKKTGGFHKHCQVYDREGQTCQRCGAVIVKEMISSRKTYYCLNCQK
ncbi:bifunctional DNA-formamidopyrimidine glycosylase/DNA-(apurinic or apyrimidinic site) lyase [Neobacillus muris]|uniref:bifunctional DNA-formamidopyrimidine glycosylase/DNA-(apurinic or apyrimidinic site) lyase n=1 Tax=Neobacillus muris TaxID=2941334 RepID=UPI0020425A5B|nr:bifunctional DNA-formamidopyrimidine glycosylase/DNA-(apurinic or apyrimidinic site) lyase [Neobacillus muris]